MKFQFSIRSTFSLLAVCSLLFYAVRNRRPTPNYHAEIDGWHSEVVAMADGRSPAICWSNNRDGITIWYYDQDHDGQIDYRHELQSHFVIHSYDDNGDGVFDRETYWKTESGYPWDSKAERRIAVAVPKTKDDEP